MEVRVLPPQLEDIVKVGLERDLEEDLKRIMEMFQVLDAFPAVEPEMGGQTSPLREDVIGEHMPDIYRLAPEVQDRFVVFVSPLKGVA